MLKSKSPRDHEVLTAVMRKVFAARKEGRKSCSFDLGYFSKRGFLFSQSLIVDLLRKRHGYIVTESGDTLQIQFAPANASHSVLS